MRRAAAIVFCLAFVAFFGLVGGVGSWASGSVFWFGKQSQDWVRVRADVASFDGSRVRYRYTVGTRDYTGDHVLFAPLHELGWVPDDVAQPIREALAGRKPITVYFDPDDPSQSVIERDVPWVEAWVLAPFALLFDLMALFALRAMLRMAIGLRPWAKDVPNGPKGMGVGGLWFFAIIWNTMAFIFGAIFVPNMIHEGEWLGLLVLLFPLIGLAVLWSAFRFTVEAIYGTTLPPGGKREKKPKRAKAALSPGQVA